MTPALTVCFVVVGLLSSWKTAPAGEEVRQRVVHSRCDFRPYKPVRLTDWLPGGIAVKVAPVYPADAKTQRVGGRVDVKLLINANGDVIRVCGRGPKMLVRAAQVAALQWKFRTPSFTIDKGPMKLPYIEESISFDFVL